MSIRVEIFRPDVVAIRAVPRLRIQNGIVAIAVPAVKVVPRFGICDLRLGRIAGAAHDDHLARYHMLVALRGRDVGFAFAY